MLRNRLWRAATLLGVAAGTTVFALVAPTLRETGVLTDPAQGIVFSVSWASDGQRIASGSQDGLTRVWDKVTAKSTGAYNDYKGKTLFTVRFSPDSGAILSAGDASTAGGPPTAIVRQVTAPLNGWDLKGAAVALAVVRDASKIAIAEDRRVSVRDLAKQTTRTFNDVGGNLKAIAWLDGKIASGDDQQIIAVWDPNGAGADPVLTIETPSAVRALAYHPASPGLLFAAGNGGVVRIFSTAVVPASKKTADEDIVAAAGSADGSTLVAAGLNTPATGTPQLVFRFWDGTTVTPFKLAAQKDSASAIGVSDDGTFVAWGVAGKKVFGLMKKDGTLVASDVAATDIVTAIAPFSNGKQVAAGYASGTIEILKLDGTQVAKLSDAGITSRVNVLALKPGVTDTVYAGYGDGTARSWTVSAMAGTAVKLGGLSGSSPIKAIAVSPGGKIAVGTAAGDVFSWEQSDPTTLKGTLSGFAGGVSALAISADSRILVAVGAGEKIVRAWDLTSRPAPLELQHLAHVGASTNGLALSGGTTTGSTPFVLEAGSTDRALMKLPLAASGAFVTEMGADVGTLAADDSAVHAGLSSGKVLSYAKADGTSPATIKLKHAQPVAGLATATGSDSKPMLLVICNGETTLQAGKVEDGSLDVVLDGLPASPKALSVDRSGRIAALGFGTTDPVTLYDLASTGMPKDHLAIIGSASATALALLPDGRLVATPPGVTKAGLWRAIGSRPEFVTVIGNGGFGVFASAWMPDGQSVVLPASNSKIQLVSLDSAAPTATTSSVDVAFALATSPDGLIASGHKDKSVKIWDSSLAKKAEVTTAHDDRVTALAFKDSNLLASGSASGQVRLWEINAAAGSITKKGAQDSAHATVVKSVAFSPDGQKLATLGFDGILILWDVTNPANPKEIVRLSPPPAHQYQGQQVDWAPDSAMLVVGASDKQAHLIQFSP